MEQLKAYLKDSSRLTEHIPSEKDWEIILPKLVRQEFPDFRFTNYQEGITKIINEQKI